jgi:hypothetical protein
LKSGCSGPQNGLRRLQKFPKLLKSGCSGPQNGLRRLKKLKSFEVWLLRPSERSPKTFFF